MLSCASNDSCAGFDFQYGVSEKCFYHSAASILNHGSELNVVQFVKEDSCAKSKRKL